MVLLTGFTQYIGQGSSLLAMVPAGSVGAYTNWKLKNVRTNLLAGLIPGILIGTYLGGTTAQFLPEGALAGHFRRRAYLDRCEASPDETAARSRPFSIKFNGGLL
jgi:uncharacterized membrane protein YfcA